MNKNQINDILNELDSFYKFTEFLPIDFRLEFSSKIESVREKVLELENNTGNEFVDKNLSHNSKKEEKLDEHTEATFKEVTSCLIPKLTKLGNQEIEKFTDEPKTKILNIIDDHSSIFELYIENISNYKNFFEFASLLYQAESEQLVTFIKTKNNIPNRGWLKIGEILSNSNLVSEKDITDALSHQENKQDIFIGEAMMDLKLITDITLRDGLKIQRWIFKISEYSLL